MGQEYETEAAFLSSHIPLDVKCILTEGYMAPGDGGGHRKVRIAIPIPVRAWHKQSLDGAWWELRETHVSPLMFGAACDALNDDTAQIRATHEYCNTFNVRPDYTEVSTFAMEANARVPINTDVDFSGAVPFFIGGMVISPTYAIERFVAFVIEDPATPVVSNNQNAVGANFVIGSLTSAQGLIPRAGWLEYFIGSGTNLPRISDRTATGSLSWRTCHKVDSDIRTQFPLPVDLSGADGQPISCAYRLNPACGIKVGHIALDASRFNNQIVFLIQRNMVTIESVEITETLVAPTVSINALISPVQCSDIVVRNVRGPVAQNVNSDGTYIFSAAWTANYTVEKCTFDGYNNVNANWGGMASTYCNGGFVINCDLNRVDIHGYSGNMVVQGSRITSRGVVYGHGYGILKVHGNTYLNVQSSDRLLRNRGDYGGAWNGDIVVTDNDILGLPAGITIVGLENVGNAVIVQNLPRTITVRNNRYARYNPTPATGTGQMLTPLALTISSDAYSVVSPVAIVLGAVECSERFRVSCTLDLASCAAPPIGAAQGCTVDMRDMPSTDASAAVVATLLIPAGQPAPIKASFRFKALIQNMGLMRLDFSGVSYSGSTITVRDSIVMRADIPSICRVIYSDCIFASPVLFGAETAAPICSARSGSNFTTISGGRLEGAFNLSHVHAAAGLASLSTGVAGAIMPIGFTRMQLAEGFQSSA